MLQSCSQRFAPALLVLTCGLVVFYAVQRAGGADATSAPISDEPVFDAAAIEFFEKKVRPVLVEHCYECHSGRANQKSGGLQLDSRDAVLRGGDTGPAVVAGKPDESLLIDAINHGDLYQMPPKSKLPRAEIEALTNWVRMRVPWPAEAAGAATANSSEFDLQARRAAHWAWQPVRSPDPPSVRDRAWPTSPIDHFVLARLEAAGIGPAAAADKRTLLRRVCFDLTGLPPTREQLDRFLADDWPDALATIVDELLASPHFGERWARHWLDVVRYAESRGHEFDHNAANAHQYRDYVIRALNDDLSYDQFAREHIAGDLLPQPRLHPEEGFNESIIGTGFWFLGEWVHSPVDTRKDEADRFDNMIDTASKAFLGLTVSCARCHDHKFDAISQRDYYALAGFLQSSAYRQARIDSWDRNERIARQLQQVRAAARKGVAEALAKLRAPALERVADLLLATRDVLGRSADAASLPQRVSTIAEKHKLDSGLLSHWVDEVQTAKQDPHHVLHLWARLLDTSATDGGEKLSATVAEVAEGWRADEARAATALDNVRVILDFDTAAPEQWITDGYAFGLGPIRTGRLLWDGDAESPSFSVATVGSARRDPAFVDLTLAPGTHKEPGALGGWIRAGQTLRTPTFTIEGGTVYYLVQGAGNAQAVVDSHRLIAGPLHGGLVKRWKFNPGEGPRWVSHDLSRYRGHNAHLEFAPQDATDFCVLLVVEADKPPAIVPSHGERVLLATFAGDSVKSPDSLARAYQKLLADTTRRLAAGQIEGRPDARDIAPLADWLVRNPQLFAVAQSDRTDRSHPSDQVGHLIAECTAAEKELQQQIVRPSRTVMAMWDGSGVDEHLLIRGNHRAVGEKVPRRLLAALAGDQPLSVPAGSGRLELARQITDPELNPLFARVMVNRIWQHLFGRGIVPSVDNFGVLGQSPTHPELLDYLATQFVRDGYSIKRSIRAIILSSTYRMASVPGGAGDRVDPDNRLLHRMRMRRLEGEAIRDAILAISGRLDRRMYGPPVPVYLTPFMQGRGRPGSGPLDGAGRRSVYISVRRNFLSPWMLVFDTPAPAGPQGRRNVSNVPAQALALMNDPFVVEQARVWARRMLAPSDLTPEQRVDELYLDAFSRSPTAEERKAALAFLDSQGEVLGLPPERRADDERVWTDLCHVLFNVKEFIFVR